MNRRHFIKNTAFSAAASYLSTLPSGYLYDDVISLTILHTNDVHSRIDPFPMDGSRNAGQGGVAKRASLIDEIRSQESHVLLLDAGDIFQGTPYFNMFKGELEMKLMTELQYDVATIGNHDFDAGIETLRKQMNHADFAFLSSNYNISDTPLHDRVLPYKIWSFGDVKVGVYGLGIELDGLVPATLYGDTRYEDPIAAAKKYESYLRHEKRCDYVICLSHLGYDYEGDKVCDVVIAQETSDTDLIIGGHTHTFMREPRVENNQKGNPVLINQVGFAGIYLGRLDVVFEKGSQKKRLDSVNIEVS